MCSTQENLLGKADQHPTTTTTTTTTTTMTTTMTTTTLTVPDTNTTIQVTGTKVTIPASFGRHPHRQPRKGLMPTPAPMWWWCPVCCSGPMLPWAEKPRESRKTGKEEEGKREEDEEDHQEYDWRHEDDFTDVWYDGMD
ncbi:hypothetical protein GE21DRAFT_1273644 [Neurospora crassa]|nr:hypothetical protein GE21DRAFT_1273644 [Neurospora crassa]